MGEPLVWAVKNGDLSAVQQIVEQPGFDINAAIMNGRASLHYAADYGQTEVIEYLVKKGAQVNLEDKHGITPLLNAIWEGHADAVKALLQHGASKSGKAPDGSSYLDCAESDSIKALLR